MLYAVRGIPARGGVFERDHTALTEQAKADIAAGFQHAACGALKLKLSRAIEQWGGADSPRAIVAGGGVIANRAVRMAIEGVANKHGIPALLAPAQHCTDNAAMIAFMGSLLPLPEQSQAMASPPRATVDRA